MSTATTFSVDFFVLAFADWFASCTFFGKLAQVGFVSRTSRVRRMVAHSKTLICCLAFVSLVGLPADRSLATQCQRWLQKRNLHRLSLAHLFVDHLCHRDQGKRSFTCTNHLFSDGTQLIGNLVWSNVADHVVLHSTRLVIDVCLFGLHVFAFTTSLRKYELGRILHKRRL